MTFRTTSAVTIFWKSALSPTPENALPGVPAASVPMLDGMMGWIPGSVWIRPPPWFPPVNAAMESHLG